jgi:hypothetical protein
VNHSWKYDGPRMAAVARSCELCGAAGRRLRSESPQGAALMTRWMTRSAEGGKWAAGRMVPCPVERRGSYVPVQELLGARLRLAGIVPEDARLDLERLPGDWRRHPTPEHPAWLARWETGGGPRMIFSCYPVRRCAEAPEVRMEGDQVIPCKKNGAP